MRALPVLALALLLPAIPACKSDPPTPTTSPAMAPLPSLHTLTARRLDGTEEKLSVYAGKVLLVVNTASECGFTSQYEGLERLHEAYAGKPFAVLGFPSNDFGGQEPGSSQEIAAFCKSRFGVTFPMFEKVHTKGEGRSPVYALLGDAKGPPKWNFYKYLVDKQGVVVASFPSTVAPESADLRKAIDEALAH